MLFAATYPERTEALVLGDTFARMRHAADYPEGLSEVDADRKGTQLYESWGREIDGRVRPIPRAGTSSTSVVFRLAHALRAALVEPRGLRTMYPVCDLDVDVRSVLGSIRVPTLVFHRRDNFWIPVAFGRISPSTSLTRASSRSRASITVLPGQRRRHAVCRAGIRHRRARGAGGDRVLATVLFTDIVGSTEKATSLGDQAWGDLLFRHHAVVRREIAHFRGREIATAGTVPGAVRRPGARGATRARRS